jgi:hypothetical protein
MICLLTGVLQNNNVHIYIQRLYVCMYKCIHRSIYIYLFIQIKDISSAFHNEFVIASPGSVHMNITNYLCLALHLPQ